MNIRVTDLMVSSVVSLPIRLAPLDPHEGETLIPPQLLGEFFLCIENQLSLFAHGGRRRWGRVMIRCYVVSVRPSDFGLRTQRQVR